MIVRILGEGQLRVDDSAVDELNELDSALEAAVERNDEAGFAPALDALLARVRALLRRSRSAARAGPPHEPEHEFSLDGPSRSLCWSDGRRLSLSEREYGLLEYLLRWPNETVSRERILSAVWEYQFDPRSNVVDVYVGRLRRKLHPAIRIETVRGGGYCLRAG